MSWNRSTKVGAKLLLKSTAAAIALVGVTGVAHAQDNEAEEQASAVETDDLIVVTARRVEEDVQDIPISVGLVDAKSLEANDILGFQDLKGSVVGLTTSRTATAGGGFVTIRGITPIATPQPSSDQGVGFFIDGVSIARSQGSGVPLIDLARVEVLRGPQGTLFGKNSSIGSINFITNAPVDYFTGSASVEVGNYDSFAVEGMLNVPVTDDLIVRFAYRHEEEDGDVANLDTGPGFNYPAPLGGGAPAPTFGLNDAESYLAKVRYTGFEGATIDYKYDRQDVTTSPKSQQIIGFNPTNGLLGLLAPMIPLQPAGAVQQSFTRLPAIFSDHATTQRIENEGHMLDVQVEIGDTAQLRSITAYRTTFSSGLTDLDGGSFIVPDVLSVPTGGLLSGFPLGANPFDPATIILPAGPLCVSCSSNTLDQNAWSQELQLNGETGALNYTVGLYYFDESAVFENTYSIFALQPNQPNYTPSLGEFALPLGTPGDYVLGNDGVYNNTSYAIYGHIDYEFSNMFDISLGLRHTWDERNTNDLRTFGSGLSSLNDSRFTWDGALNFHPTPDILIFAKYARGYTSGGIDSNITFLPEINDQVELGFKSEFWDGRARVNGSVYKSWIENRHSTVPNVSSGAGCSPVLLAAGFTAGNCPVGLFVFNLPGTTKIFGFEIETFVQPTEGLTLSANFGYNDPDFPTGELHRAPKTQFAFSAQYDAPEFSNGMYLNARIDGDYRGDYFGTGGNIPGTFDPANNPPLNPVFLNGLSNAEYLAGLERASTAGDYWLVNARIALSDIPLGPINAELAGYVRNIFDVTDPLFSVNYGASYHASYETPRTYGLILTAQF